MKTQIIKTKKQLENEGWMFITLDGGAIRARSKDNQTILTARSMATLRRKLS